LPGSVGSVGVPTHIGLGSGSDLMTSLAPSVSGGSAPAAVVDPNAAHFAALAALAAPTLDYLFYIVSPRDIVVARPRDYDDHITWLLARARYEEALHYAKAFSAHLRTHSVYLIGENFLTYLFDVEQNYSKAAQYCVRLLGTSKSLWETYVLAFAAKDKLSYIAPYIPVASPTLKPAIYEMVLQSYLDAGARALASRPPAGASLVGGAPGAAALAAEQACTAAAADAHGQLLHLLQTWSHHLYNLAHVIASIAAKLADIEQDEAQRRSLERAAAQAKQGNAVVPTTASLQAEREVQRRRDLIAEELRLRDAESTGIKRGAAGSPTSAGSTSSGPPRTLTPLLLSPALYPPPPPLPPPSTMLLLECLGHLYLLNKQYGLAFDAFLRLQRRDELFRILHTYALVLLEQKLVDERNIALLMRISLRDTLALLLGGPPSSGNNSSGGGGGGGGMDGAASPKDVMEQLRQAQNQLQKELAQTNPQSSSTAVVPAVPSKDNPNPYASGPLPVPTFRAFQLEYLHALFKKDAASGPGQRYHDEQVVLYAELAMQPVRHPSEVLLHFLKNSNGYTLERALEACEATHLYPEQVFLLKRMGNTERALSLIVDQLHDVREAINFVEDNGGRTHASSGSGGGGSGSHHGGPGDNSLWESLITRSLSNPAFLSDLLEHVGSHYVDLSALILRIPGNLAIPKLKQKLITILSDCELQQSVIKGCTTIMANDCVALAARLHRRRKRAIKVPLGTRCCICEVEVLSSSGGGISAGQGQAGSRSGGGTPASSSIVVFFCRHAMHRSCADAQRSVSERRTEFACPKCDVHAHGHSTSLQQQQQSPSNNAKPSSTPTAAATPSSSVAAKSPRVGAIAVGTPSTHGRGLPSVGLSPLPTARSVLPIPGAASSASTVLPFAATPSSSSSMFPSPAVATAHTATGPTSGSVSSSAHTRTLSSTPTAAAFASSSSSSATTALHAPHSARSATPSTGGSGAFFAAQQQLLQQQQQPTPASLLHSASPANAPRGSLSGRQPQPSARKH
jgi:hypothetical protein